MEHNDFSDGLESYLQEKANEHKLYPSDKVWSAIQQKINRPKKWPFVALTIIFIGLGMITSVIEPPNNQLAVRIPAKKLNYIGASISKHITRYISNDIVKEAPAPNFKLAKNYTKSSNQDISSSNNIDENITSISINATNEAAVVIDAENTTSISTPASTLNMVSNNVENDEESSDIEPLNSTIDLSQVQIDKSQPLENEIPKIIPPIVIANTQLKKLKLNWQYYFSPTVSYRTLSGSGSVPVNFISQSLTAGTTNFANVNDVVSHKAAVGFELGAGISYNLTKKIKLKTGLQFNYNQYDISAYNSTPELTPLIAGGIGNAEINAISNHRSKNGYSQTWLKNLHAMISVPIGAEITILGNQNISLNVGGSIQPTYILRHDAYMLSTNLNNYAKENSLNRNFNINTAAEVFISVQKFGFKWTMGPQIRYQIFSSYKKEYPIIEHLKDFGFKIGLSKTINR
jgi:antitoxin component of MazEF toxin-antitoxin module